MEFCFYSNGIRTWDFLAHRLALAMELNTQIPTLSYFHGFNYNRTTLFHSESSTYVKVISRLFSFSVFENKFKFYFNLATAGLASTQIPLKRTWINRKKEHYRKMEHWIESEKLIKKIDFTIKIIEIEKGTVPQRETYRIKASISLMNDCQVWLSTSIENPYYLTDRLCIVISNSWR